MGGGGGGGREGGGGQCSHLPLSRRSLYHKSARTVMRSTKPEYSLKSVHRLTRSRLDLLAPASPNVLQGHGTGAG